MVSIAITSGQISSRPHTTDFPQMVVIVREILAISGKSRLVKYYSIWPDVRIPINYSSKCDAHSAYQKTRLQVDYREKM